MRTEEIRKNRKKAALFMICAALIFAMFAAPHFSANVYAASKADRAFDKKISALKKKCSGMSYKYADIVGNSTHEALVQYDLKNGDGFHFVIYSYKNGKVKTALDTRIYGLAKITAYKSSKSLICYNAGHGGETYSYYKMNGKGKYILKACKSREAIAGGSVKNGSWYYYDGKMNKVTKSAFNTKTKGIKKGKKKTLNLSKWKTIYS